MVLHAKPPVTPLPGRLSIPKQRLRSLNRNIWSDQWILWFRTPVFIYTKPNRLKSQGRWEMDPSVCFECILCVLKRNFSLKEEFGRLTALPWEIHKRNHIYMVDASFVCVPPCMGIIMVAILRGKFRKVKNSFSHFRIWIAPLKLSAQFLI